MRYLKSLSLIVFIGIITAACNDFLDVEPKGAVNEESLDNPQGAEKLINAAYASLGNDHWSEPYTSMWPYGSVRSDNAYKGGLGTADQGGYHHYEVFSSIRV